MMAKNTDGTPNFQDLTAEIESGLDLPKDLDSDQIPHSDEEVLEVLGAEPMEPELQPESVRKLLEELGEKPTPAQEVPDAPPGPEDEVVGLRAENQKLLQKLGRQGSERGDIIERVERLENENKQLRSTTQPAVTAQRLMEELDPERAWDEETRNKLGSFALRLSTLFGNAIQSREQATANELASLKRDYSEAVAEMKAGGGMPKEIKDKILTEYPGVARIQDADERIAVMRALARGAGILRQSSAPVAGNAGVRRDAASHVGGGSVSQPRTASDRRSILDKSFEDALGEVKFDQKGNRAREMLDALLAGDLKVF